MNAPALPPTSWPSIPATTRAGEGFDRKAWTVVELYAMVDAGVMDEDAPFELIDGDLLAMSPKYNKHEVWKRNLVRFLIKALPDDFAVSIEPTLILDDRSAPEPDVLVTRRGVLPLDVRGPDVLLLVEVCDSSQRRDLVLKAGLYARSGVPFYWVLDADGRRIVAHAEPATEGYRRVETHGLEADLPLPFRPDVALRPSDLDVV